jgi:IS605 OrfB family transposase
MDIYNSLIINCIGLTKLDTSSKNLLFLYEKNIFNILNNFYYYKYFIVKDGLINKKPIKIEFNEIFKTHVMTTEEPIKFMIKTDYKKILIDYLNKDIINKEEKIELLSEKAFIFNIVYNTIEFDKTSSDIIVQTIKKANTTMNSYYKLKEKGLKANKPHFIKEDFYSIIFCGKTIKLEDDNINNKQIRILFGNYITKNWNKYFNEDLLEMPILKIKKPTLLNNENIKLKQIEIKKVANRIYKVHYTVDKPKPIEVDTSNLKLKDVISIDLGLKNLMTIHDPDGKQLILKGGYLTSLNEYYKNKISIVQSKRELEKNQQEKERLNNEIKLLNDERLRKLNGKMNEIIKKLKELYPNKKLIVIGYNEGWKTKINLGRKNNKTFYDVPYSRLIKKMKYAFDGKAEIVEINEAYTSKCDALGNEDIKKHEVYKGERCKRGLFKSSVHKLINADLNGAINILRKFTDCKYKDIKGLSLFNPERITL